MRAEPETGTRMLRPEDFIEVDEKRKCATFEFKMGEEKINFQVPSSAARSMQVAKRVAAMCFEKLRDGASAKEAAKFREELVSGYQHGADVPPESGAWEACRVSLKHPFPLVSFQWACK